MLLAEIFIAIDPRPLCIQLKSCVIAVYSGKEMQDRCYSPADVVECSNSPCALQ